MAAGRHWQKKKQKHSSECLQSCVDDGTPRGHLIRVNLKKTGGVYKSNGGSYDHSEEGATFVRSQRIMFWSACAAITVQRDTTFTSLFSSYVM